MTSALSYLQRGAIVLAVILLLDPQPLPLRLLRNFRVAQEALAREDYASAAKALADAAARLPYDRNTVYRASVAEIAAGSFDSATRRLLSSAAADGWSPTEQVTLGDAYWGQGKTEEAILQWEQAAQTLKDDTGLLTRLARAYEVQGRYPEAVTALNALAQKAEDNQAALYRLALLTAVTRPEDARARVRVVIDRNPNLEPALRGLLSALDEGQQSGELAYTFGKTGLALMQLKEWALAEEAFKRATALNAGYADAFAYLGLTQDMQGEDGQTAYQTAIQLAPSSPLPRFFLGLHWRRLGESAEALPYLKAAQELDEQNPAIAAEIGGAYASTGDLQQAEVWFSKAVELAPQNGDFWLLLARFHTDNEFHVDENGLPAARMAVGLLPNSAEAADALGYALTLTGDVVNAEKSLQNALRLNPQLPSAYYHLGVLYIKTNQYPQASAALEHALALDPNGPVGGQALKALARVP